MRKLLMLAAAGLIVAAGQAQAKSALAARPGDRVAAKPAQASQLFGDRPPSLGLIATFVIAVGVGAWLLDQAQDSTPVSP